MEESSEGRKTQDKGKSRIKGRKAKKDRVDRKRSLLYYSTEKMV